MDDGGGGNNDDGSVTSGCLVPRSSVVMTMVTTASMSRAINNIKSVIP